MLRGERVWKSQTQVQMKDAVEGEVRDNFACGTLQNMGGGKKREKRMFLWREFGDATDFVANVSSFLVNLNLYNLMLFDA